MSFYVFVSNERSYFVTDSSCSCPAFVFKSLKDSKGTCYHIEALKLANATDSVRKVILDSTTCYHVIIDLLTAGKSLILYKLWLSRE
ncbi:MAG: SWIM zinc finger family protein [Thermoprotei archaeon]